MCGPTDCPMWYYSWRNWEPVYWQGMILRSLWFLPCGQWGFDSNRNGWISNNGVDCVLQFFGRSNFIQLTFWCQCSKLTKHLKNKGDIKWNKLGFLISQPNSHSCIFKKIHTWKVQGTSILSTIHIAGRHTVADVRLSKLTNYAKYSVLQLYFPLDGQL